MKLSIVYSIVFTASFAIANPFRRAGDRDECRLPGFSMFERMTLGRASCPNIKTDICVRFRGQNCVKWGSPDVAAILSDVAKANDPAKILANGTEPAPNDPYKLKSLNRIEYNPQTLEPLVHAGCASKLDRFAKRVETKSFGYTREDLAALHKVGCVFWYDQIKPVKQEA